MSNTISPSNPNTITLDPNDVNVWQFPAGADVDSNPAADAHAEYLHHQYIETLSAPEPVNELEAVPAPGEIAGYATNDGRAIDPHHTESVLAAAATAVDTAYGATPEVLAAAADRENRERKIAADEQAGIYAPRVVVMRDRALIDWELAA